MGTEESNGVPDTADLAGIAEGLRDCTARSMAAEVAFADLNGSILPDQTLVLSQCLAFATAVAFGPSPKSITERAHWT